MRRAWWSRLRDLLRWRRRESELDEEIRFHLSEETEAGTAEGLPLDEARGAAIRDFGNVALVREDTRDAWGWRASERVAQDLRHGWRSLRATPIVTTVAVVSLALGIGANTAVFSIVDSLFLRSLPVSDPAGLVLLNGRTGRRTHFTNPIWEEARARASMFAGAIAWSSTRFNLSNSGETDLVQGLWVSGSFFRVLGVPATLGRTFVDADDERGGGPGGPVAVISHGLWQRRFGGDADVIGRVLTVERVPYTIVGVTAPEFFGLEIGRTFDVAIPIGTEPLVRGAESLLDRRSAWWLRVMLRLTPEQTVESVDPIVLAMHRQIRDATLPAGWSREDYLREGLAATPAAAGASDLRDRYRRPLLAMMAVVGLVLVIACANIANLLLARAAVRRRELGLRAALGASRFRIARQLLCESVLLAGAGAASGVLLARWGSDFIVRQLSTANTTVFLPLSLHWHMLAFTAAVAGGTVLLFGIAPAMRGAEVRPHDAVRGGRTVAGDRHVFGVSHLLVVAQVTLTLVLVVAAGLFGRTIASLADVPLGFAPDPVLVATVTVSGNGTVPEQRPELFGRLLNAAAAVPGVMSAALSETTPLSQNTWNNRIQLAGGPPIGGDAPLAYFNAVSPAWFRTYGTRVLAGRDFSAVDAAAGAPTAIVNEAFARTFTSGRSPIGVRVRQGDSPERHIVGVVENAVYESVREPVPPTVYIPYLQRGPYPAYGSISVRAASRSAATLTRSLVGALAGVDRNVAVSVAPLSDHVEASLTQERVVAILSAFFGGLALLLAALGLYGVTAYSVSQRRTEIGVRMALGALPGGVVRLVLGRLAILVATGLAIGSVASLWAATFVSSLLFGLEPGDPLTLAVAIVVVVVAGLAAGSIPAIRASRVDPARVLRES
jgi:predicted permease